MEVSLDGKVAIVTGAGPNIGGLANFVRAAAMDLAPYGIRVNSFSPAAPIPLDDTVIDDEA